MQRRLPLLFSLLALSLLGIYGFQGYWLYGNYQLAAAQFARTTREALEAAVQHQQLSRASTMFNHTLRRDSAAPLAHVLQLNPAGPGQPPGRAPQVVIIRSAGSLARPMGAASAADSLALRLSRLVVGNWVARRPANLHQLGRAYRAELRQRQAELPFRLDTLPTRTAALPVATVRAGFTQPTPAVALNPVSGPYLVASFRPPTAYVLGRLARGLAGSALLLALTTACFALLAGTILRQKKLAEVKNDFINNMTHELKTPLATVSAAVEALQDFGALADPRKTDAYLTIARQELARLSDLVEKVLHIAVEERRGRILALHPEPVRLAELVAAATSRHALHATKAVEFDVAIDPAATLPADPLHLAGVLNNLLDNAVKYSGERVCIRLRSQREAGGWRLTVADDGLGIAPGYQQAVFEQFFRVPTGNLHPVKGFGLGLYYAHQVIASHGGHLSLRSEVGRGSEFTIWLPGGGA